MPETRKEKFWVFVEEQINIGIPCWGTALLAGAMFTDKNIFVIITAVFLMGVPFFFRFSFITELRRKDDAPKQ